MKPDETGADAASHPRNVGPTCLTHVADLTVLQSLPIHSILGGLLQATWA